MALEKNLFAIAPTLFTADGGSDGKITVPNACDFKVKQRVKVSGTALDQLDLEVKRVISKTEMYLGPISGPISDRTDLSAYTVATSSFVYAIEQKRPSIPFEELTRAVYEEEPTVAYRNVLVDKLGKFYAEDNPLSVQLSDGSINIGTVNGELEVQLSRRDNDPDAGDVHDSVRIGNQDNEATYTTNDDSSKAALDVAALNRLIDIPHDDIEVTQFNSRGDPEIIEIRENGQLKRTLNFTYTTSGDFQRVVRT